MDWQLVAIYFTVKSTDILQCTMNPQFSSHKSVQKLFHNLFTIFPNSLMGFSVIFHLEKELLKGVSDVQELLFLNYFFGERLTVEV